MIWLGKRLLRDFPNWERPAQIAFVIGVGLLVLTLATAALGPQEVRVSALLGTGALLLVLQATILWANRGMVATFTKAQRHYLAGEFEQAIELLENARRENAADMRMLTLLGNTYRQRGALDKSRAVLYEALDKAPNHYFPLYGFGRTLLSEGSYVEAAEVLRRAVNAGAPAGVHVDLAEAHYRAGKYSEALAELKDLDVRSIADEPHRKLITTYMLYRLNGGDPPNETLVQSGIPYWEAAAERFRDTQYGTDLAQDLQHMRRRIE